MSTLVAGATGIAAFFGLLVLRMPIAISMALVGFAGSASGFDTAAFSMRPRILATFILLLKRNWHVCLTGFLAYYSGIGSRLYVFAYKLIGNYPGGLAIATQTACAVFGAICGSNTATAATMGAIALPEMKKYKYDTSLATASVAAGGVLGILIPPSVIFIVYGMATEQSVGKLFMAGIVPGILLMLLYMGGLPACCPQPGPGASRTRSSWKERLAALARTGGGPGGFALSAASLPAGLPTEAGAVGAGGVLLVSLLGRRLTWENFKRSLLDATRTTAMIMFMVAGAVIFGRF